MKLRVLAQNYPSTPGAVACHARIAATHALRTGPWLKVWLTHWDQSVRQSVDCLFAP